MVRVPLLRVSSHSQNLHFLFQSLAHPLLLHFQIVARLEVQPLLRRHLEIAAETERGVRCHGSLALHDFIGATRRHSNVEREPILAQAQRLQEILVFIG